MLEGLLSRTGELDWLGTDAGALMLLPQALFPLWSGTEPPEDGRVVTSIHRWDGDHSRPACDYDRACEINDAAAVLPIGSGSGIVLGGEPLPATWQPLPAGGGILARLYTSEVGTPGELPPLPDDLQWAPVGDYMADGAPQLLVDTTDTGVNPVWPSLPVTLAAGRYVVETATLQHPTMELWLVRLRPAGE